jgi:hypothetical protein
MPAWRARERVRDIYDGDEGASFQLIEVWATQIIENDTTGPYIALKRYLKEALKLYLLCLDQLDQDLRLHDLSMPLILILDHNTALHFLLLLELMLKIIFFL